MMKYSLKILDIYNNNDSTVPALENVDWGKWALDALMDDKDRADFEGYPAHFGWTPDLKVIQDIEHHPRGRQMPAGLAELTNYQLNTISANETENDIQ